MAAQLAEQAGIEILTTVAVVEDNPTLRKYLADLIGGTKGHKCVCACESAEEALVEIPKHRPNVVLMDIHLPGESGIVCTARLRQVMPDVEIIMLTVYKDIKMIFQALKAGACGYLLKRADEAEILNAIAEVRTGGAPMTSEIARMVVRSFTIPLASKLGTAVPGQSTSKGQLSTREMDILALVAEGYPNKDIASRLNISGGTVRTHLMNIYKKLHVHCRTEAAAKYIRTNPSDPSAHAPIG